MQPIPCHVTCHVFVYSKVRPAPSSWSLDSVKEGMPHSSDSGGRMLCPPVPPRPPYSGKRKKKKLIQESAPVTNGTNFPV